MQNLDSGLLCGSLFNGLGFEEITLPLRLDEDGGGVDNPP
jgi:hypothetical protein